MGYWGRAGAAVNWATLLALGLGDIVAIDFMARVFAADSPQTVQKACFIGSIGTIVIGVPFSIVAVCASPILKQVGVTSNDPVLFGLLQNVIPQSKLKNRMIGIAPEISTIFQQV